MHIPQNGTPSLCYVITKANAGGAQRYVRDLLDEALRRRVPVTLVYGDDGLLSLRAKDLGIDAIRIPSLSRDVALMSDILAFFALWRIFRVRRFTTVHLNSSKVGALGALAARLARVPHIIFTAHGWASTENRPDWQKAFIQGIHWITVMLAHRTIAVSEHTKKELAHLPFMNAKIEIIHNAIIDATLLSKREARAALADRLPPDSDKGVVWVGMIGELHPNKGIDVALQGFSEITKKFPDARLIVIGEGEERARLESLIRELGLGGTVHLLGFIPDASSYLSAFDLLLFPSRKEGFPYVILEAGNAGIPVIATAVGGIPEAIRDMETGFLIHPQNPQEVTRALSALLAEPDRRARFGEAFKKDVTERFPLEKMLRATFALYGL